jgi:hypothetical protein
MQAWSVVFSVTGASAVVVLLFAATTGAWELLLRISAEKSA